MPGLSIVIPFVDRVKPLIDLREQVVSFPPQPVITSDNLVVGIDTVIYFQVTDAKAAEYEVEDYILAIEQLTVTTLRNVIGGLHLEATLTSRDQINGMLRGVLDEATGKWGIKVNRVEIKAIQPPASIQDSMEKQMRAERDRRAAILTAEGVKQSQILTAEGEKQSAILRAQGARESQILRAEGEAKAIETVFAAIHAGDADEKLLAYQYLQTLPQIAQGQSNKMWIIPSEFTQAMQGLARGVPGLAGGQADAPQDRGVAAGNRPDGRGRRSTPAGGPAGESADERPAVREAEEAAREASAAADDATALPAGGGARALMTDARSAGPAPAPAADVAGHGQGDGDGRRPGDDAVHDWDRARASVPVRSR
jgi:regulator of protease activity HflC (stomatin/prohibitin superfamily)